MMVRTCCPGRYAKHTKTLPPPPPVCRFRPACQAVLDKPYFSRTRQRQVCPSLDVDTDRLSVFPLTPHSSQRGTKIRVENIHYELTKEDIEGLFRRIGPVLSTELVYDRAGRSDGVAYITYEIYDDAKEAIREFDGANAKGVCFSPPSPPPSSLSLSYPPFSVGLTTPHPSTDCIHRPTHSSVHCAVGRRRRPALRL